MQISSQPKGWSDAEVDQIIASVSAIETQVDSIEANTYYIYAHANAITTSLYFIVLVLGIYLGYLVSPYFLPSPKDISG